MATKAKIERERQRLLEKYGDKVLAEIVDYYYPEVTFLKTGETRRNVCATISLSEAQIDNTAELRAIERRLMEPKPLVRKWKFQQSEDLYNSPEEVARRKDYIKDHKWLSIDNVFLPMLINEDVDPDESEPDATEESPEDVQP